MSPERIVSLRNPWFSASVGITAAVAVAGAIAGFVWLPMERQGAGFHDVWNTICTAAGLVEVSPAIDPIVQSQHPTTQVEVTPRMLRATDRDAESIGRGATLALRCTMCHGIVGLSLAQAPNLAGQYSLAIYKQLADFKTGARVSSVMGPLATDLTDADMRDLAAYYAYLPRAPDHGDATGGAPRIATGGAPMRGIAPCGACHGTIGRKAGAPWLGGQPVAYLHAQLRSFASGGRRNDIDGQMRNIARAMTQAEIDTVSRFYATTP
jgi:cytochrome c553